jgi:aconitate hydratase
MGILPCQFAEGVSAQTLGIDGSETFDLLDVAGPLRPRQPARLRVHRRDGSQEDVPVTVRIDTPIEAEYHRNGGIMQYVLRQLLART